jgi:hypothetical protein
MMYGDGGETVDELCSAFRSSSSVRTLSNKNELAHGLHTISQLRMSCLKVHIAPGSECRADGKESQILVVTQKSCLNEIVRVSLSAATSVNVRLARSR